MPEPENDADFTFTGAPEDYPEEWMEAARSGTLRLRSGSTSLRGTSAHCRCRWDRRHDRTPDMVLARQVPFLPGLQ